MANAATAGMHARLPIEAVSSRGSRGCGGTGEAGRAEQPPAPASGMTIGRSREGRDIVAHRLGRGPLHLSLIAGCHADEPVGPAMLRRLAAHLESLPEEAPWLAAASWWIVPHANPDGEERNRAWTEITLPAGDSP